MRVNSRVFSERMDMLEGIRIPNCPSQFKVIAENIMNMAIKPGVSFTNYHTVTELDNTLALAYWREYDNMPLSSNNSFEDWFIHKATSWELIRRSRQWLSEHHYVILSPDVAERAYQAGEKFSRAIKQ